MSVTDASYGDLATAQHLEQLQIGGREGVPWAEDNDVCASDSDAAGCSTRRRTHQFVLGFDLALMAVGVLLLARRRGQRK